MTLWQRLTQPRVPRDNVATTPAWPLAAANRLLHLHFATAFTTILLILLVAYGWLQFQRFQADVAFWDVLFISGIATFIVGFRLALSIPERLKSMLARLQNRDVLRCDAAALSAFEGRLDSVAREWGWGFAGLVVGLLVLATLIARGWQFYLGDVSFIVILAVTGGVAGNYIGRIALCGLLAWQLKRDGIPLEVKPGHVDGCAGLKPIGDFYFYQAMVTALPALFVAVWLLLIPVWSYRSYDNWREPYLGLLPFAIAFEVLAFIVPVFSFHRVMATQKDALLREADALSLEIARIEGELAGGQANLPRDVMKDQLTYLAKQYQDLENMPTWPVSTELRTRFTVNNVVLLLPIITRVAGIDARWPDVGKTLSEIFGAIKSP